MHMNHASHALLKIQYVHASGVLKTLFILSKHGTKTNIRSTKMANSRHAYNRDVLQSYIGRQMGYHYTVVSRLVRKRTQTNNVKDLPRSGRPRVTSDGDVRELQCLVRRMPFATSPVLKQHWLPNIRLSTRTMVAMRLDLDRFDCTLYIHIVCGFVVTVLFSIYQISHSVIQLNTSNDFYRGIECFKKIIHSQ